MGGGGLRFLLIVGILGLPSLLALAFASSVAYARGYLEKVQRRNKDRGAAEGVSNVTASDIPNFNGAVGTTGGKQRAGAINSQY